MNILDNSGHDSWNFNLVFPISSSPEIGGATVFLVNREMENGQTSQTSLWRLNSGNDQMLNFLKFEGSQGV
jgi:hypothetical protein